VGRLNHGTKSQDYTSIVLQLEQWPERYVGLLTRKAASCDTDSHHATGLPICSCLGGGWLQWHVPVRWQMPPFSKSLRLRHKRGCQDSLKRRSVQGVL